MDGQKVPIRRARLRTVERREQRLGSYELFQRSGPLQLGVWDKMMRGLSTRNYGAVVKEFHNAYGIEKSAVSENFIEASREKVKDGLEKQLEALKSQKSELTAAIDALEAEVTMVKLQQMESKYQTDNSRLAKIKADKDCQVSRG